MERRHFDGMYACLQKHFVGFQDETVKAALLDYWCGKLTIVYEVHDVLEVISNYGYAISEGSAQEILQTLAWGFDDHFDEAVKRTAKEQKMLKCALTSEQEDAGGVWCLNDQGAVVEHL